jgi:hypothetical protein
MTGSADLTALTENKYCMKVGLNSFDQNSNEMKRNVTEVVVSSKRWARVFFIHKHLILFLTYEWIQ